MAQHCLSVLWGISDKEMPEIIKVDHNHLIIPVFLIVNCDSPLLPCIFPH